MGAGCTRPKHYLLASISRAFPSEEEYFNHFLQLLKVVRSVISTYLPTYLPTYTYFTYLRESFPFHFLRLLKRPESKSLYLSRFIIYELDSQNIISKKGGDKDENNISS